MEGTHEKRFQSAPQMRWALGLWYIWPTGKSGAAPLDIPKLSPLEYTEIGTVLKHLLTLCAVVFTMRRISISVHIHDIAL